MFSDDRGCDQQADAIVFGIEVCWFLGHLDLIVTVVSSGTTGNTMNARKKERAGIRPWF